MKYTHSRLKADVPEPLFPPNSTTKKADGPEPLFPPSSTTKLESWSKVLASVFFVLIITAASFTVYSGAQ